MFYGSYACFTPMLHMFYSQINMCWLLMLYIYLELKLPMGLIHIPAISWDLYVIQNQQTEHHYCTEVHRYIFWWRKALTKSQNLCPGVIREGVGNIFLNPLLRGGWIFLLLIRGGGISSTPGQEGLVFFSTLGRESWLFFRIFHELFWTSFKQGGKFWQKFGISNF